MSAAVADSGSRGSEATGLTRLRVALPIVSSLLLVFGASLGASMLFLKLRFTEAGPAILYPPYAILTAALMLVPARRWWWYMLAASAGSFFPHVTQSPIRYVLLSEVANYSKAVVAASGVRRFSVPGFDTLRSMTMFLLFAAFAGPMSAAFIGAAIAVVFHGAADYWLIWRGWFLSNALTGVTLLPIIVIVLARPRPWTLPRARRMIEAAVLCAAIFAVSWYVFVMNDVPTGQPARLYAPLPLLLWAAVRFGPAGTSAALLAVTMLAVGGAVSGHGPFVSRSPGENILELQLFIMALSLPLMLLTAVVEERRNNERALHRSEAALRDSYAQVHNLAGRLITAQEDERTFIARELHDDICQRLAGLVLKLEGLRSRLHSASPELRDEAARAHTVAFQVTETVRNMSHELHPGTLHYIGLVASLRDHCNRFSSEHPVNVELQAHRDLNDIPADVALCLYRVTQEALRNVAAHSEARHARVELRRTATALELAVTDDGQGFDPEEGMRSGGLGLISLDERVRLLGGTVTIQSEQQGGTRLLVRLPLAPEDKAGRRLQQA